MAGNSGKRRKRNESKGHWGGVDWNRVLRGSLIAGAGGSCILLDITSWLGGLRFGEAGGFVIALGMIVWGAYDVIFGIAGEQGVW